MLDSVSAADDDFQSVNSIIRFTQDQTEVEVGVEIFDDTLNEEDERFEIVISLPDNLVDVTLSPDVATVTIFNILRLN